MDVILCLFTCLCMSVNIETVYGTDSGSGSLYEVRHRHKRGDTINATDSETFEVNEIKQPCANNPCRNGGKCAPDHKNPTKEFQCACQIGFVGKTCEEAIPACESLSCIRRGDCLASPSGALCICDTSDRGRLCRLNTDMTSPWGTVRSALTDPTKHLLVLVFGLTLSILAFVAVCLCLHCCRASAKSKQLREKYKAKIQEGFIPRDVPPDLLAVSNALCRSFLCCPSKQDILKDEADNKKTDRGYK